MCWYHFYQSVSIPTATYFAWRNKFFQPTEDWSRVCVWHGVLALPHCLNIAVFAHVKLSILAFSEMYTHSHESGASWRKLAQENQVHSGLRLYFYVGRSKESQSKWMERTFEHQAFGSTLLYLYRTETDSYRVYWMRREDAHKKQKKKQNNHL